MSICVSGFGSSPSPAVDSAPDMSDGAMLDARVLMLAKSDGVPAPDGVAEPPWVPAKSPLKTGCCACEADPTGVKLNNGFLTVSFSPSEDVSLLANLIGSFGV